MQSVPRRVLELAHHCRASVTRNNYVLIGNGAISRQAHTSLHASNMPHPSHLFGSRIADRSEAHVRQAIALLNLLLRQPMLGV